jgi:hypothetical protein
MVLEDSNTTGLGPEHAQDDSQAHNSKLNPGEDSVVATNEAGMQGTGHGMYIP